MRPQRSFLPLRQGYFQSYLHREDLLLEIAKRYPDCSQWPAEEALLISALVLSLEREENSYVAKILRHCGLISPPKLRHDRYRLIKYLFSHWHDPQIRERILTKIIVFRRDVIRRQSANFTPEKANRELRYLSPTFLIAPMQAIGLHAEADALLAMLDEEGMAYYRGDVLVGQIICYQLWRSPDPVVLSPLERRLLAQRLQRHTHRLQRLRRSIYHMDRERKALVQLGWEAERRASQVLDELIRHQERIEAELTTSIRDHAQRIASLQARQAEDLKTQRERLESRRAELAEVLAERGRWSRPTPLAGFTVLVVGEMSHEEAYRSVILELGGRPILVDGLHHLGRIREVAPEADAAILVSATVKHAAEAALVASIRSDCLFLYCPRAGRQSLERTLRAELLPRLIALQAAAGEQEVSKR